MTFNWRGAYALFAAAALGVAGSAYGQSGADGVVLAHPMNGAASSGVQQTSCSDSSYDCGVATDCGVAMDCGDPCGLDLGAGCGVGGCPGQVFVGAEWLSLRANFSEATAYRTIDRDENLETFNQFDFNYGDSYRVYAGYRLCDCGGEFRFTYSSLNSDGGFNSGPQTDPDVTFSAPYELVLGGLGDSISGTADVSIDTYDIAFAKTIPLGTPLGCGDCCDPCGCVCPAWDLQWIGGIRVANVDSSLAYQSTVLPANASVNAQSRNAVSRVNFDGVGLRAGMLGRRYFGRNGFASVYIRGDVSMLLGDVEYSADGSQNGAFRPVSISSTQVIPVTELEAGVTTYLTNNLTFTAGYMLSAWHDLGHRAEYDFTLTGTQLNSMDDANMMTLDGFFLRAEAAF